jgi:hypothetical protein
MALAAAIDRISPNMLLETLDNVVVRSNIIFLPLFLFASNDATFLMRYILGDNAFNPGSPQDQSSA